MPTTKSRVYPNLRAYLKARKRGGATQAEIAEQFNISPGHLSDLKKGKARPSLDLAMRLSEECGIPIESFQ